MCNGITANFNRTFYFTDLVGENNCEPLHNLNWFIGSLSVTEIKPACLVMMLCSGIVCNTFSNKMKENLTHIWENIMDCCTFDTRSIASTSYQTLLNPAVYMAKGKHNLDGKTPTDFTLFDILIYFKNDENDHAIKGSNFNKILGSKLFFYSIPTLHYKPYLASILRILLKNLRNFGLKCFWALMLKIAEEGEVSLDVILSETDPSGNPIEFCFLVLLPMFGPTDLFERAIIMCISDEFSSSNLTSLSNRWEPRRDPIFLLGSALNGAIATHNNAIVTFIILKMANISAIFPFGAVNFLHGIYHSPFSLLKFLYPKLGKINSNRCELHGYRTPLRPDPIMLNQIDEFAASFKINISLGLGAYGDFELPTNAFDLIGAPENPHNEYRMCTPLGVSCASYNNNAIQRLL